MLLRASILLLFACALAVPRAFGQVLSREDSINFSKLHFTHNKFINNIFRQAVNSVKRTPGNDLQNAYLNGKSEDPYLPYQGKIIRHIYVETINFDRSFKDTSKRDNSWAARAGNRLHKHSRKWVIRDNLFIQENTPLNAFKLADNERYIRTLEYINDARIIVDTLVNNPDSVDITVFTKDLFSIAGGFASNGLNHDNLDVYDANLAGLGQRLEATSLFDYNRNPNWAFGGLYRKDNVAHTFADVTVGYSTMGVSNYTHEEQSAYYIMLNRPLVSPYSRYAGGFTISHNESYNLYKGVPDSIVYPYKFDYYDAWAGYNIGIGQLTATNNTIRDRRFLALRYYRRDFQQIPYQVGNRFDPLLNSSEAVLAQVTFFRQDYFKTQYVYGFGTTEDLPYGYNIAVTGGWHKQLSLERPYGGVNMSKYVATGWGDFLQFYFRSGGFLSKNTIQDGSILLGAAAFSRLFFWNSTKIRQYININYTQLFNRVTYAPLRIDNFYGLRGYLSDSVYGGQRATIQFETEFYLRYKLLGFQFAPFPYADVSLITAEGQPYSKTTMHASIGGGFRARNENLVFETIELRAFFFPAGPTNAHWFKVVLNSNIKYRYPSNLITEPDVVQLNTQ